MFLKTIKTINYKNVITTLDPERPGNKHIFVMKLI